MKNVLVYASLFFLIACSSQSTHKFELLDVLDRNAAILDGQTYLGEGAQILAVCGGSKGYGLYLDDIELGYQEGSLTDGVIIYGLSKDGSPEILFRDALKEMVVASEHGAEISRLNVNDDPRLGIWTLVHPRAGIVETYNLTLGEKNQLYSLWTANKSSGSLLGRTTSYVARCEFI